MLRPSIFSAIRLVLAVVALSGIMFSSSLGADKDRTIRIYITDPTSKQKILPSTPPSLFPIIAGSVRDNTIRVSACRGEFEPASFVIRPTENIDRLTVSVTDLQGLGSSVLPKDTVDIRIVKCWYQSGISNNKGPKTLVPDLLLKDDGLVRVDIASESNYLRVTLGNRKQYVNATTLGTSLPRSALVNDAKTFQPFAVAANTNKQIWLTVAVPLAASSGDYKGTISVRGSEGKVLATINVVLTVLPFDLAAPAIDYGIYYVGQLKQGTVSGINASDKSHAQYTAEMQNMLDHGVKYPTLFEPPSKMLGQALQIRKGVGLPADKIYIFGVETGAKSYTDPKALSRLARDVTAYKNILSGYDYKELYIYGRDEARGPQLTAQRPAWELAHGLGVKVFAACYPTVWDVNSGYGAGAPSLVGDLLDLPVLGGGLQPQEVETWHKLSKKVFIYGNPHAGIEDPDVYRRNYGLAAICNGYDGVMDFAYQDDFGADIWNDFSSSPLPGMAKQRSELYAYPTSDGVIDTIAWEGFREGVDDVRYLTTLAKTSGVSNYKSICKSLSLDGDLNSVRRAIINRIISTRNNK
jgi:hypothetical protein